ncbi:hypothetical protein K439DRAFT_1625144 [Ramaria rubella]|nr:hypothetical protein K439DRAFT_1625144 [Ramaria rubella]
MPPNLRDTLCMIEYSPEGVSPAIHRLGGHTLQLEDVDIWVWLKLVKPKKDSLVFLQKLTELFTVHGHVEKVFDWKCPHAEKLLSELAQWLGTYMRVDPARALVNIEPYFVRKQSKFCYNVTAQRVLDTRKGQIFTSLHIPTPTHCPGFWGSPRTSDDDSSLDRRGRGPPHSQAPTDVPLTGPPTPSAHMVEDNPMEDGS